MAVYQNTTTDLARTAPPIDPEADLHRSGSSAYHLDHSAQTIAAFEPTEITGNGAQHPKLDVLQTKPLGDLFRTHRRRYLNYVDTKSANSSQRMAVYNRLGNLQLNMDRLQSSFDKYTAKSNSSTSDASVKKPKSRLKKLQSEVHLDVEAIGGQIQAFSTQMEELREQDRRLQHAEDAFDNSTRALFTALKRNHLTDDDGDFDMQSEVSLVPSSAYQSVRSDAIASPILPELGEYYKALSEMRNMHERILYLEGERNEQWERRGMLEEQDQYLDQTDNEFLEGWENVLNEAEVNYESARAATEEARHACEAANVAIPDWDDASSVDADSKQQHSLLSHHEKIIPPSIQPLPQLFDGIVAETLPEDHSSPLSTPPLSPKLAENRVSQWVDHVVPSVAPVSSVNAEEPSVDMSEGWSSITRPASHPDTKANVIRSTSCPVLSHLSDITPVESTRPQTSRSLGIGNKFQAMIAIRGMQPPLLAFPT